MDEDNRSEIVIDPVLVNRTSMSNATMDKILNAERLNQIRLYRTERISISCSYTRTHTIAGIQSERARIALLAFTFRSNKREYTCIRMMEKLRRKKSKQSSFQTSGFWLLWINYMVINVKQFDAPTCCQLPTTIYVSHQKSFVIIRHSLSPITNIRW